MACSAWPAAASWGAQTQTAPLLTAPCGRAEGIGHQAFIMGTSCVLASSPAHGTSERGPDAVLAAVQAEQASPGRCPGLVGG